MSDKDPPGGGIDNVAIAVPPTTSLELMEISTSPSIVNTSSEEEFEIIQVQDGLLKNNRIDVAAIDVSVAPADAKPSSDDGELRMNNNKNSQ